MVTGDNLETAVAIAKEAGIISSTGISNNAGIPTSSGYAGKNKSNSGRYRCMTGPEFRKQVGGLREEVGPDGLKKEVIVNQSQFREIVKELRVLARSTPHDKYILTVGLKNEGNVVAVTGDGTNDAAALRHANIGFAMGRAGTEVAKEAASIILLDDNFGSLVTSIKWGRNVYDSIRKFLQFQLTANLVAIFMALMGGVFLGDSPLNSVQMLWVNLIMDTFAAMALATEPPKEDIIKGRPYPKNDRIITPVMWRNILG
jgi:magnesium-transporting ATPase (P-type)